MRPLLFIVILPILLSLLAHRYPIPCDESMWSTMYATMYTVAGIMFSIAMSLFVTTSFSSVRNVRLRDRFRGEADSLRNRFLASFVVITLLYVWPIDFSFIDMGVLKSSSCLFCVVYFIVNFLAIQKLIREVDDKVSGEK